jgi:hypothetical protein
MAEFTKMGHRLEFDRESKGLVFTCRARWVGFTKVTGFRRSKNHLILAKIQVFAPCTESAIVRALRGWLSVYGDEELVAQVDHVVAEALKGMKDMPEGPASPNPQKGQMN